MNSNTLHTHRDISLDAIAGVLMIVVIMTHWQWLPKDGTGMLLFSFFMCWFFWKAGMMHKADSVLDFKTCLRLFKKIVIPFCFWGVIGVFLWLMYLQISGDILQTEKFLEKIKSAPSTIFFIKNPPLWFIYPFLFCKIISIILFRFKSRWVYILYAIFWGAVACCYHYLDIYWGPQFLKNGSLGMMFYVLGFLLKDHQYENRYFYLSLFVFVILKTLFPARISMSHMELVYGNFCLAILADVCGVIVIDNLFKRIKYFRLPLFCYIGVNSMLVYMCHPIIMDGIRFWTGGLFQNESMLHVVQTVLLVILLMFSVRLFQHPYLRWTYGGTRR